MVAYFLNHFKDLNHSEIERIPLIGKQTLEKKLVKNKKKLNSWGKVSCVLDIVLISFYDNVNEISKFEGFSIHYTMANKNKKMLKSPAECFFFINDGNFFFYMYVMILRIKTFFFVCSMI